MSRLLSTFILVLYAIFSFGQTCIGITDINACSGSFDDGSGSGIYGTNMNCTWHLRNDSSKQIRLSFNDVDIEWGFDIISVYDGEDANAPLIGQLLDVGDNPEFISNGSDLFISFTSDNSVSLQGWVANYSCLDVPIPNYIAIEELSDMSFQEDTLFITTAVAIKNNQFTSIDLSYEVVIDTSASVTLSIDSVGFNPNLDTLIVHRNFSFEELNIPSGVYGIVVTVNPLNDILETKYDDNEYKKDKQWIEYCGIQTYRECFDTIKIKSDLDSDEIVTCINPRNMNAKHIELNIGEINLKEGESLEVNYKHRADDFFVNLRTWDMDNYMPTKLISPGPLVQVILNSYKVGIEDIEIPYQCIEEELVDVLASLFVTRDGNDLNCRINVRNISSSRIDSLEAVIGIVKLEDGLPTGIQKELTDKFLFGILQAESLTSIAINIDLENKDILPGEYIIYIDLDPENSISEFDEDNNRFTSTSLLVIPFCELGNVLNDCSGIIQDGSGSELTNIGAACSWMMKSDDVEHYVVTFTEYDFSDPGAKVNIYDSGIMYNELIATFNSLNLPYPVASSTGEIKVKFENFTDTEEEGWEFEYRCEVEKRYNFNYLYEYLNYSSISDIINIEAEVKNASSIPIEELMIGCYLSTDSILTIDDFKFFETSLGALGAAESKYFKLSEILNPYIIDLERGHYYYGFIIDPDNDYDELLESDNILVSKGTIGIDYCNGINIFNDCTGTIVDGSDDKPYLDNSWCDFFIQPDNGGDVVIEFTHLNWKSPNDSLLIFDDRFQTKRLLHVIKGDSEPDALGILKTKKEISLSWRRGDSNPAPEEGWELEYVCQTDLPNLLVRPLGQIDKLNKEITLSYQLKNDSGHSISSFKINYVLSTTKVPLSSSIIIDSELISSMEGPESQYRTVVLNLEPFLKEIWEGHKYIGVVIDTDNDIEEVDESDNYFYNRDPIDVLVTNKEVDLFSYIKVFPNPTNNLLHVEWSELDGNNFSKVQILNSLGKKVYESAIPNNDNDYQVIDVSSFPPGVFIIKLMSDGRAASKTFIKMD